MNGRLIDIRAPDGICDAYLSVAAGAGPHPAVLFYMDGIGLRPSIHAMVDRLAQAGYTVLAPNTFYRLGRAPLIDPPLLALDPERRPWLLRNVMSVTPERVLMDAACFLDALAATPGVDASRQLAVTGYCMGGGMAVRVAAAFPARIAAAASFHGGRLVTEAPDSPHRLLASVRAELYFGHADHDPGMTPDNIATLESALAAAGGIWQSELYAGALHGYSMADVPAYDQSACERHWLRLLDLLDRTLPVNPAPRSD